LIFFLDGRSFFRQAIIPLALALGAIGAHAPVFAGSTAHHLGQRVPRWGFALLIIALLAIDLALPSPVAQGNGRVTALSPEERAAMAWVQAETAATARFLVISGDTWALDRSGEWLPSLAGRVSVATPQGNEWVPGGVFWSRVEAHRTAQACSTRDGACLENWSRQSGLSFTHVYLPKRGGPDCDLYLRCALRADPAYRVLYDGPGATIFARVESERAEINAA
jgi:hypothetical protein